MHKYIKKASGLLLHKICFFRHCCFIRLVEKSIPDATFIIGKYPVHSLNCAIYFPLLNTETVINSEKKRFFNGTHRPVLGVFLRDTDGKIVGIPQCHSLGTTMVFLSAKGP